MYEVGKLEDGILMARRQRERRAKENRRKSRERRKRQQEHVEGFFIDRRGDEDRSKRLKRFEVSLMFKIILELLLNYQQYRKILRAKSWFVLMQLLQRL